MLRKLRSLLGGRTGDDELAREIRMHLELEAEEQVERGLSAQEAARAARRAFGNPTVVRQICREASPGAWAADLLQDTRYGARMLARSPGFTAVAVLILAVAIAVNTAVFTAFDAILFRPLDARDSDKVVTLLQRTKENRDDDWFSWNDYVNYRDHARTLSGIAAISNVAASMTAATVGGRAQQGFGGLSGSLGFHFPGLLTAGSAEPLIAAVVSENYFAMMGVHPALGRTFSPEDARGPESDPYLVLSFEYWKRRFDANPAIVGAVIELNRHPFTVIGVMPAGYLGTMPAVPNAWLPISMEPELRPASNWLSSPDADILRLCGRLAPGISAEQAQAELAAVTAHQARPLAGTNAKAAQRRIKVVRAAFGGGAPPDAQDLAVVFFALAAVGLLLVIACANVASLLLARSAARSREIAIRLSLGAGRLRLVRQLLTESMLLSTIAGAAGLLVSYWLLHLLIRTIGEQIPQYWGTVVLNLTPDLHVFGYAIMLSCIAAVAFGLAPALQVSKPDLSATLKQESAATVLPRAGARLRLPKRDVLIAVQIAVCLVLLVAAGLLAQSSRKALTIASGYDIGRLMSLELLQPADLEKHPAALARIETDMLYRLRALPQARSVTAAAHSLLFAGARLTNISLGDRATPGAGSPEVLYSEIDPDFFATFGIPILRGRPFTDAECRAGEPVAIVSESTARRFWPGQNVIGKRIAIGGPNRAADWFGEAAPSSPSVQIIGVAADARLVELRSPDATHLYLPWKAGVVWPQYYIRTTGDPAAIIPSLRQAVRATAPGMIGVTLSGRDAVTNHPGFVLPRLGAILCGMISVLALLLAAAGIYGTVSFAVSRRTAEIGIRMTLGARSRNVLRLVLSETMRPVVWGIAAGFVLSAAAARVMVAVLLGVSPLDPLTFSAAAGFLAAMALLAAYGPARRATRLDPMVALRHD
ncbi:MAG TPA: ABC transporter permease [Bryobacteraceae bacterium]|nr:ABC transporter permease [Bryobacteraceae bacterium]